jgi:serine acetyltransferase
MPVEIGAASIVIDINQAALVAFFPGRIVVQQAEAEYV